MPYIKKINPLWCLVTGFITLSSMLGCQPQFNPAYPGTQGDTTTYFKQDALNLLISAYAVLDHVDSTSSFPAYSWATAGDNWIYGSVSGDDSHKGADPGDQSDLSPIENRELVPTNSFITAVWFARYEGVRRCNSALLAIRKAVDASSDDTLRLGAEARFLRAYYHFDLKKIFGNIPFIDEKTKVSGDTMQVNNTQDVWPLIEEDMAYAYANLPEVQVTPARANKWAAAAYLAKAYVYQHKWADALALLHTIIQQGRNAQGLKYALLPAFADNFNAQKNHVDDPEIVFAINYTVNDGTNASNANQGDVLNFPYGTTAPAGCCGFNQPSFSLVNAFKVDAATGLPLIGNTAGEDTYNSSNLKSDLGISSKDDYTPDNSTAVDPRLDWTVGRRGIPYLDWGTMPGDIWIRNQAFGGPYAPIKTAFYKSQQGTVTDNSAWTFGFTSNNTMLMRYADVLLMAAEAEAEAGTLENAQGLVNQVRNRVSSPSTWVQGSSANYKIGLYPAGYFASRGQAFARHAVQFERRLELAMEGHRFFDLVRYGTAADEINRYILHEKNTYQPYFSAQFTPGKNEVFPVPQLAIDLSTVNGKPSLVQNPGY